MTGFTNKAEFLARLGKQPVWQPPRRKSARRTLFDMSAMTHCSIIGTCLTMQELRRIVVKIAGEAARKMTDHEIHTKGVGYASTEGLPTKLLTKALDDKHAGAIQKIFNVQDEKGIRDFWQTARREGSVEGAYWAVATHPVTSESYFNEVFGDVHMLSHLVGASNRIDIKKLIMLTAEKERLEVELSAAQRELRAEWTSRDREIATLRDLLARCAPRETPQSQQKETEQVENLQKALKRSNDQLMGQSRRIKALEEKVTILSREKKEALADNIVFRSKNSALQTEISELEVLLGCKKESPINLHGKRILYVGGVTRGVQFIRQSVERLGANFDHHDGGHEQATILLRGLVSRADIVLVALDFVSHEAALLCKSLSAQHGKEFVPLAHAGVGTVMRALNDRF